MSTKYDIEILNSSGKNLVDLGGKFLEITTVEQQHKFPKFKFKITPGVFLDMENDELQFRITTDYFSFNCPATITDMSYDATVSTVSGIMCTRDQLFTAKTRYLGASTKLAYNTLKFNQKLSIENNFTAEHFQVNMTDVEYLKVLCSTESFTPYWGIGMDEIILKKSNDLYAFVAFEKANPIVVHHQKKDEFEVVTENYTNTYFTSTSGKNSMLSLESNKDAMPNYIQNEFLGKNILPIATLKGSSNEIYPRKLGEQIGNVFADFSFIERWLVTGIERVYKVNEVATNVTLTGIMS